MWLAEQDTPGVQQQQDQPCARDLKLFQPVAAMDLSHKEVASRCYKQTRSVATLSHPGLAKENFRFSSSSRVW